MNFAHIINIDKYNCYMLSFLWIFIILKRMKILSVDLFAVEFGLEIEKYIGMATIQETQILQILKIK